MRFKLRQMEVFRAVMLTGSMNGAAKLLFVSQPAVSRLIAHTEQSLGLQLFARDKGKLTPTPEAHRRFEEPQPGAELPAARHGAIPGALSERPAEVPHDAAGGHGARALGAQGRTGRVGTAHRPSKSDRRTVRHRANGLHPAHGPSAGSPSGGWTGRTGRVSAGAIQPQHPVRPIGGGGVSASRRGLDRVG
ncbi:hypothetical protein G6F68_012483 [Rhizopus microsporus]|nr:hypothetical protein G6F68_012483 [Rhizopus microsporus]